MQRKPRITVGVPVFRGQHLVAEALQSIQSQSHTDFQVIVSVDNNDEVSTAACRPFESDPRFRVVVQDRQLGWAGNINWLAAQADSEFFHYVAQDDRLDPAYQETLLAYADRHPEVLVVTPDVRLFGESDSLFSDALLAGSPFDRVLAQLTYCRGMPFFGLTRTTVWRTVPPMVVDRFESSLEFLVWIMNVVRLGQVHFVHRTLYFKRLHRESSGHRTRKWPPDYLRAAWIDSWIRLFGAAWPAAETKEQAQTILALAVSQVASPNSGYEFFYHTGLLSTPGRRQLCEEMMAGIEREPGLNVALRFGSDWPEVRARCLAEAKVQRSMSEWLWAWVRHPRKMLKQRFGGRKPDASLAR
jgi:hypothetical protein